MSGGMRAERLAAIATPDGVLEWCSGECGAAARVAAAAASALESMVALEDLLFTRVKRIAVELGSGAYVLISRLSDRVLVLYAENITQGAAHVLLRKLEDSEQR